MPRARTRGQIQRANGTSYTQISNESQTFSVQGARDVGFDLEFVVKVFPGRDRPLTALRCSIAERRSILAYFGGQISAKTGIKYLFHANAL
jgi:hypothetical protein